MTYTAREKAADFGRGVATGGAIAAVVAVAVRNGVPALAKVSPTAAKVVGGILSVRTAVGVMAVGAGVGAYRAHQNGSSMVGGALGGAMLIFPKAEPVQFPASATASSDRDTDAREIKVPSLAHGLAPEAKKETPEQARERLGQKFGGTPNDLRLAAQNDRNNMAKAKTQQQRDAYERRALLAEQEYERRTGQHIGPTAAVKPVSPSTPLPASAIATAKSGLDKVLDFGRELVSGKSDPNDPFALRRKALLADQEVIRKQLEKGSTLRPDTLAAKEKNEKALKDLDKEERDANAGNKALLLSVGAAVGGGYIGHRMGKAVIATAEAGAAAAAKGVESVSRGAAKLVNASPKGMLNGTIEGDKAIAAVVVASKSVNAPHVSVAAAYGVPAVSGTVAAGSITYATKNPDDPMATALRTEGYASGALAFFSVKAGIVARGIRSTVSPQAQASIKSAEQRIVREFESGKSAVVTQIKSKVETIKARAGIGAATHQAEGRVAAAQKSSVATGQVAAEQSKGRVAVARSQAEVAKHEGNAAASKAAGRSGVAKEKAATAVETTRVQGKISVEKAKGGKQVDQYRDTWTVQRKNGLTYTASRHDTSVRRGTGRPKPAKPEAAPIIHPSPARAANGN